MSSQKNHERVCVVTGGSAGIGLATATGFAKKGYHICFCGRDANKLENAKKFLEEKGGTCSHRILDLRDEDQLIDWLNAIIQEQGKIDILVNNAGKAPLSQIDQLPIQEFQDAMSINVNAVFRAVQTVWPIMKSQGNGVIINISSLASIDPFPGFSVYGACKAWVNLFTKSIADEGKPLGIRVFSLALGAVETEMLRGLFPNFPKKQTLSPEAVADFIVRLDEEAMKPLSGQTFFLKK